MTMVLIIVFPVPYTCVYIQEWVSWTKKCLELEGGEGWLISVRRWFRVPSVETIYWFSVPMQFEQYFCLRSVIKLVSWHARKSLHCHSGANVAHAHLSPSSVLPLVCVCMSVPVCICLCVSVCIYHYTWLFQVTLNHSWIRLPLTVHANHFHSALILLPWK